jgi:membrane protease YdiL (CAAX protease family)
MVGDRDEGPGHAPASPLAAALWTTALWVLTEVALAVTAAVRPGAETDLVNLTGCVVLATSLVVFAMARVHAREVSLRSTLGVARPAVLQLLLAVAAGGGLVPAASTVHRLLRARWPYDEAQNRLMESLNAVPNMRARIVYVACACVVLPLADELFFRGILFGQLKRSAGARTAAIGTAVFYAVSQLDHRVLPTALLLGLALAHLRERTGTVLAPVAAHVAYEAVEGLPVLRGADPLLEVVYPARWIVGGLVIAVLALGAVGLGQRRKD